MFTLLGFSFPVLLMLPVEMLAEVFRNLDSKSLVNVMMSSTHFTKVCKGDPVLRRRIRAQLLLEKQLHRQVLMNPSYGFAVTRKSVPKMFMKNVVKTVTIRQGSPLVPNYVDLHSTQNIVADSRRCGGGKERRKSTKVRVEPYKNLRC